MARKDAIISEIIKVKGGKLLQVKDMLAVEEPLEISIAYGPVPQTKKSISVTMRTPGHDFELATGFLFTEGIISNAGDILGVNHPNKFDENKVEVSLREDVLIALKKLERNFYTTSSCGVCGKSSIDAVRSVCSFTTAKDDAFFIDENLLHSLPGMLRSNQKVFENTGGLHACGLFNSIGELLLLMEDVGRHNAVDKLVGAALNKSLLPLHNTLLLLSGRASFELIQKAWMAGITMVAAVGAPSSLAVSMAIECGMTLVGFLRNETFNIYSGAHRIVHSTYESSY